MYRVPLQSVKDLWNKRTKQLTCWPSNRMVTHIHIYTVAFVGKARLKTTEVHGDLCLLTPSETLSLDEFGILVRSDQIPSRVRHSQSPYICTRTCYTVPGCCNMWARVPLSKGASKDLESCCIYFVLKYSVKPQTNFISKYLLPKFRINCKKSLTRIAFGTKQVPSSNKYRIRWRKWMFYA